MIYLFSSANSLNSILTIDKKSKEGGSDSIFQLAKENNIDQVFLIEKNPSSFPQALSNATELGATARLRVIVDSLRRLGR